MPNYQLQVSNAAMNALIGAIPALNWVLVGVLVVAGVMYLAFVSHLAKDQVSAAPREDMFLCEVHGPIARRHVLKLEGYTEKPIEYCPICWRDKIKAAEKKK
jgi:hypothetical protein